MTETKAPLGAQYDQLKQIIQKANPEIMELKFGCEVDIVGLGVGVVIEDYGTNGEDVRLLILEHNRIQEDICFAKETLRNSEHTVFGRPIRLADALLALGKERYEFEIVAQNNKAEGRLLNVLVDKWNLADDNLDHQSDGCKSFLINLLVA